VSFVLEYWQEAVHAEQPGRWVPVEIHEHIHLSKIGDSPFQTTLDGGADDAAERGRPAVREIKPSNARGKSAFEDFLRAATYGEPKVHAWAYPDPYDKVLKLLGVDYPVPPILWWKDKTPYLEMPPTEDG
jgi:hypothetical protein